MSSKIRGGASNDAIMLIGIKFITVLIGLAVTRLLCQYLTVYDYGTYTQSMLIVSTVNTITILGMIDGINFFFCSEQDPTKREAYVSTICTLQCIVSAVAGSVVLLIGEKICYHFENPELRKLLVFSASLPLFINLVSMLQVLLVSVGKAKMLAMRNLIVSLLRLAVVFVVIHWINNVIVLMAATLMIDIAQVLVFTWILRKNNCRICIRAIDFNLSKRIITYCIPMGVFTAISALNRDMDKYLIALVEDTEILAMYSNAAKVLPFDIIMSSFCTVLVPQITRFVAQDDKQKALQLYRVFLEIAYMTTAVLCSAALVASPQLMKLLYSDKYTAGLRVFQIYIVVDLLRFTNITIILAAAGKTAKLMLYSIGSLAFNFVANVVLYRCFGIVGPAVATLLTTLFLGMCILFSGASELDTKLSGLFDVKYLLLFAVECVAVALLLLPVREWLAVKDVYYVWILMIICALYGLFMVILSGKRLLHDLKQVNRATTD